MSEAQTDSQLLTAWRAGDRVAGEVLLTRYFPSILRFFRGKLGMDVEDLVQRTFLDCVESRDRVEPGGFRAYLFGVARNRLYDHLRRTYRSPSYTSIGQHSVADLGTSPSGVIARKQDQRLLLHALRAIPVEQQVLLELAYWEQLSGNEIAQALSIEPNTVRSRLARARAALRGQIERLAAEPHLAQSTLRALDERVSQTTLKDEATPS